ncbi:MAG: hypothetical protein LBE13_08360 [Bacteroidales bacterium]|jgi:hypothetical protein|nr:hypothetical protein [Bacteroidales bacterium]
MKTKFIILAIFTSIVFASFAQEYYYWYKDEKILLELVPTKKYVMVSPDDTVALKTKLSEANAKCSSFIPVSMNSIKYLDGVQPLNYYFAIIEGQNLPDFSKESNIFEAPVFKRDNNGDIYEIAITYAVHVKLKSMNDFSLLEMQAQESGVEILGSNTSVPEIFTLSCVNASKENPLNIANLFQEKALFEWTEPEVLTLRDNFITANDKPISDSSVDISISSTDIIIDAKGEYVDYLAIYALDGKTLLYSRYSNNSRLKLNLPTYKGIVILKIVLQSDKVLSRKFLLNN